MSGMHDTSFSNSGETQSSTFCAPCMCQNALTSTPGARAKWWMLASGCGEGTCFCMSEQLFDGLFNGLSHFALLPNLGHSRSRITVFRAPRSW